MGELSQIRYLPYEEIDKSKWDNRITTAGNGLIYAYSYYLDHMAERWDALILGDYEAVMPLPHKKKFGIRYLYQPFLTAQLGIFGNDINREIVGSFLNSIPDYFKYGDIYLNHANVYVIPGKDLYLRSNYVLSLKEEYTILSSNYRENIRRNIKRSEDAGCKASKDFNVEQVIELALEQMKTQKSESSRNVECFRGLYHNLQAKKMATTYGISSSSGQLLASCVFFFSHNRGYYILVGNHPDGRTIGASHALIDSFIRNQAGKELVLDFEGSDLRNLAFFYSSFGAKEEKYAGLKWNKLPFYIRFFKK